VRSVAFVALAGIPSAYCIDTRPEWLLYYDLGTPFANRCQ
jgi:hypothetical protein